MRGSRSTTRTPSGTTMSNAWSPTPRSPRWPSPRSPPDPRPSRSAAGSWCAGSPASTPPPPPRASQSCSAPTAIHAVFTDHRPWPWCTAADHPPRSRHHRQPSTPTSATGPLAHLPSGSFAANAAWLACATMAFNLTRAAGALASVFHAKATTATIRAQLVNVPARLARSARRLTLHLPRGWPWKSAWSQLFAHGCGPPIAAPSYHPASDRPNWTQVEPPDSEVRGSTLRSRRPRRPH